MLVETNNVRTLYRLNTDGSTDAGFLPSAVEGEVALQYDGRILVSRRYGSLSRLNTDGSEDGTFSAPPSMIGGIGHVLPRRDGKVIVWYGGTFILLDRDGSFDPSFRFQPLPWALSVWSLVEAADGRLFTGLVDSPVDPRPHTTTGVGAVFDWTPDGRWGGELARFRQPGVRLYCDPGSFSFAPNLVPGGPGQMFMAGSFKTVEGFARPGLARLFTHPPERDFRVRTPAEFFPARGVARVRVVRTGATLDRASVSFSTRDDTARAGEDYAAQSGRLDFAPLEVAKEVLVPLSPRIRAESRKRFHFELSGPSPGYEIIAATPIVIVPDLRIVSDSFRLAADGSVNLSVRGTMPERWYHLESSMDLKDWQWVADGQAAGGTVTFENVPQRPPPQFFRARY